MKRLLFFLCLIFCGFSGFGQEFKSLEIEAGMAFQQVQDLGHSPLIYHGSGLDLGIRYTKKRNALQSVVQLGFMQNELAPDIALEYDPDFNQANRTHVRAHYNLSRAVDLKPFTMYVGGQARGVLDYITFNHKANNPVSYELSLTLDPVIGLEFPVGESMDFAIQTSFPLMGYGVRPEALGLFKLKDFDADLGGILTGGSVVTLNKLFDFQFRMDMKFQLGAFKAGMYYEYAGGVNHIRERKAHSTHSLGLQIPIELKIKRS